MDENTLQECLVKTLQETSTFLSVPVFNRVCILPSSKCDSSNDVPQILTNAGTLDWKKLEQFLDLKNFSGKGSNYDNVISKFGPCMECVFRFYTMLSLDEFESNFSCHLQWTRNEKVFVRAFQILQERKPISNILACLILTAYLERSLCYVHLMRNNSLPYLLRDILLTSELKEIFGDDVIILLMVLMGTPAGLNIRNILWHGFMSPLELNDKYGFFLLCLTASLGEKLRAVGSEPVDVPTQQYASLEYCENISKTFPEWGEQEVQCHENLIQLPMIEKHTAVYWQEALLLFHKGKYGESLVLIMPLLESILRLIHVCANNRPHHVVTAEHEAPYITLTEVFSEYLNDGSKNLFSTFFTKNEMVLFLDLFIYPEGPRIRDKLSHGEYNLLNFPKSTANNFLVITAFVFLKCKMFPEKYIAENEFISLSTYESYYHPNSKLKLKVSQFLKILKDWNVCPFSVPEVTKSTEVNYSLHSAEVCIQTACRIHKHFNAIGKWNSLIDGLDECGSFLSSCDITTLYQPKCSAELTVLLTNIIINCFNASENTIKALTQFYEHWNAMLLRSRQRMTYERLLKSIPFLYCSLRVILILVLCYMYDINHIHECSKEDMKTCSKFLKKVLKYIENINIMTSIKMNKWLEVQEYSTKFLCDVQLHLVTLEMKTSHI